MRTLGPLEHCIETLALLVCHRWRVVPPTDAEGVRFVLKAVDVGLQVVAEAGESWIEAPLLRTRADLLAIAREAA